MRLVGSVAEVACQEVRRGVMAEAPKYLVMVLPWAVKVERLGKQIAGVEVEEAHWKSSGLPNQQLPDGRLLWDVGRGGDGAPQGEPDKMKGSDEGKK